LNGDGFADVAVGVPGESVLDTTWSRARDNPRLRAACARASTRQMVGRRIELVSPGWARAGC